ncbi:MAG: hypothetical protein IJ841_05615 [Prevotella sp.]|nr:hypothetical protein [Prevotella sp.]
MKLKYFFPLLMAALTMFVACSDDDNDVAVLDGLRVSQSYVSLNTDGGSTDIILTAAADWSFEADNIPAWLTVTPASGGAGETKVTFQADATPDGRTAALRIVSGELAQEVNVIQGTSEAALATCKEVIEGNDGKTYKVRGTIVSIRNTHYGNIDIADETGQIYLYGTNDKSGKAGNDPVASWGLEVGDVITVVGPKTTYNGTVELVNVDVVAIEKSLVKIIAPTEPTALGVAGGEFQLKLAYKGIGVVPVIPADASWLHMADMELIKGTATAVEPNPADTAVVTFLADANEGASRKTTIEIKCTNGSTSSNITYSVSQEAFVLPHGFRADDPFTASEAVAYVSAMASGEKTMDDVYVKGKISSIKFTYSAQYGTATYNISDDGQEVNVFTVYGSYYLDGNPWVEGNEQIEVGDEVLVCGKAVNYNGNTPEFSNKENHLVSIKKAGAVEKGTLEHPFNVAEAIAYIDGGGADDVYVEGIVSKVVYTFDADHGTGTFWISADGEYHSDYALDFEAYSVLWLGNRNWADGDGQVAVGDRVVLAGKLTKYKDTYETSSKKAYIYSINGKTE